MKYGSLLDKLLNKDYLSLSFNEIKILNNNKVVFGLDKKFQVLYEKIELEVLSKGEVSLDNLVKVKEILEVDLLPRVIILENLSSVIIDENELKVNFKGDFIKNLTLMNNNQICYFIDIMSFYIRKHKIRFFGVGRNNEIAYHMINKVVSDSLGLRFVFDIFGKNCTENFVHLEINRLKKELFIESLDKYCISYIYILDIISKIVLDYDEQLLSKKSLKFEINKEIKEFKNVIEEDKKLFKTKDRRFRTWSYFIEALNERGE